jgi:hypothetical protein
MLFIRGNAMSGAPSINEWYKSISEPTNYDRHNYKENYNESVGCDDDVVDLIISN